MSVNTWGVDVRTDFWQDVDSSSTIPNWVRERREREWAAVRGQACIALMADRLRCTRPAVDGWCEFHFDRVIEHVARQNEDRILNWVARMNPSAFRYFIKASQVEDADRVLLESNAQVYFIACGNYVKIGYSKQPAARLAQIKHGRNAARGKTLCPDGIDLTEAVIVGCIPGGQATERQLHFDLRAHRVIGEWFRLTPTVIDVIDCLVFGGPPPSRIEARLRRQDGVA